MCAIFLTHVLCALIRTAMVSCTHVPGGGCRSRVSVKLQRRFSTPKEAERQLGSFSASDVQHVHVNFFERGSDNIHSAYTRVSIQATKSSFSHDN